VLTVLCPTRGRIAGVNATLESFLLTARLPDTHLVFIINDDEDPEPYALVPHLIVPKQEWMNQVLQLGTELVLADDPAPDYLGFIGDDNRFRTPGWDETITGLLNFMGGGFAYGDDLAQHATVPAHVFVSTPIVRALGYFGLPGLFHLYMDNAWKMLGERAACMYYEPKVIVEHLHPNFSNAEWDDSYRRTNSDAVYDHDYAVFKEWVEGRKSEEDVEKVKAAIWHE